MLYRYFNITDDAYALQGHGEAAIKVGKKKREMKYFWRGIFNGLTEK